MESGIWNPDAVAEQTLICYLTSVLEGQRSMGEGRGHFLMTSHSSHKATKNDLTFALTKRS